MLNMMEIDNFIEHSNNQIKNTLLTIITNIRSTLLLNQKKKKDYKRHNHAFYNSCIYVCKINNFLNTDLNISN